MNTIHFSASEIIREKILGLKFGLIFARQISVEKENADFTREFTELQDFLNTKFSQKRPAEDDIVSYVRRMYRRIGWEPTRYRPSSEALIRRILKGNALYRINNLVDFGNLVSARFHLPMGLYDIGKIGDSITMDVGNEGESYRGISKPEIHAEGKLILRDAQGIFGNPTADSLRSSITAQTSSALAIFFCPPEVESSYLQQTLNFLSAYYGKFSADGDIETKIISFD